MTAAIDRASLAGCVAELVGCAAAEVPAADTLADLRSWLAARNLGLVPVRDPDAFTWPGPFLAVRDTAAGRFAVVMFGVPPGVLHDPGAAGPGALAEAWVLAPFDRLLPTGAGAYGQPGSTPGRVEAIVVAPAAEAEAEMVDRAIVAADGIEGDRYAAAIGSFSDTPGSGRALTLIEAEVLDELDLAPALARRNVVTRGIALNPLVGRRFRIGDVECVGARLCEPCALLDRLAGRGLLRPLVHRGGLRADVLAGGELEVGAPVAALD
jgi:hypothetical protein